MKTSVLCTLFMLVALSTSATVTRVQSKSNFSGSGTSCAVTFASNPSQSDLIVVWTFWQPTTASVSSVTDSVGNLYASAIGPTTQPGSPGGVAQMFYTINQTTAADTITVTYSASTTACSAVIVEYNGASTYSPLDVTQASTGNSSTLSTGLATPKNSNVLIFGAGAVATGTASAGSGFNAIQASGGYITEDDVLITNAQQQATASSSSSGNWAMQMAVFDDGQNNWSGTQYPLFQGPNPWVDARAFGARPIMTNPSGTCNTTPGSASATCNFASSLIVGDGIVISCNSSNQCAGAPGTQTAPTAPTVTSPFVQGSQTFNYYCVGVSGVDSGGNNGRDLTTASSAGKTTTAPAVFGNMPIGVSNVSWSSGTVTITTSTTFDPNSSSYTANSKSVSITGMGTGLTSLDGYWVIASEPSTMSFTFSLSGSGSGTFSSATARAVNAYLGSSITRTASAVMTITSTQTLPIVAATYTRPTVIELVGWLPSDLNGLYSIEPNQGDSVTGSTITLNNVPSNLAETSTQAGVINVYEANVVACPAITSPTAQYIVYGQDSPGGTIYPIGETKYGEPDFYDWGAWIRTMDLGIVLPPYVPQALPSTAQHGIYWGQITAINGNTITVSPALPSSGTAVSAANAYHDDTVPFLNAQTQAESTSNGGTVVLSPPIPSCSFCSYHFYAPLQVALKTSIEVDAPLSLYETMFLPGTNSVFKGVHAVFVTGGGQFGQKTYVGVAGWANPLFAITGSQVTVSGFSFSANGQGNGQAGQDLVEVTNGAEYLNFYDNYFAGGNNPTSAGLDFVGNANGASQIRMDGNSFVGSWPNSSNGVAGQTNWLDPHFAMLVFECTANASGCVMPGAIQITGDYGFSGRGILVDSSNEGNAPFTTFEISGFNDYQQPVTPIFTLYGGSQSNRISISGTNMDSVAIPAIATLTGLSPIQMELNRIQTSVSASGPFQYDGHVLSGKSIAALLIRNSSLLGQNYSLGGVEFLTGSGRTYSFPVNSASTTFGSNLSAQTITSSAPYTGVYIVTLVADESLAGIGCSATTNSVSVSLSWTGQGGSSESQSSLATLSFSGNGARDQQAQQTYMILAKVGTAITYTTTSSLGSTGCTTTPQYQIYAKTAF